MKLYRSRKNFRLFGLCGGIAEATGIDPTLVRLAVALITLFTGGFAFFLYIALCMLIPKAPLAYAAPPAAGWYCDYDYGAAKAAEDAESRTLRLEIEALRAKLSLYEQQVRTEAETGLGR